MGCRVMTKLTLSADAKVVEKAKRLAAEQQTSVSAMFGRFVRSVTTETPGDKPLGPLTRKATGLITLPRAKTDRQLLEDALLEKHGLKR